MQINNHCLDNGLKIEQKIKLKLVKKLIENLLRNRSDENC